MLSDCMKANSPKCSRETAIMIAITDSEWCLRGKYHERSMFNDVFHVEMTFHLCGSVAVILTCCQIEALGSVIRSVTWPTSFCTNGSA